MEFAEHLTIKDIITEGANSFSYSTKRRRADILEVVRGSAEMQKVVIRAYNRKKERQQDDRQGRFKRARLEFAAHDGDSTTDSDFLNNPDETVKEQALARFIDRTGNYRTHQASCISCAQEHFIDEMNHVYLDEIPHRHLLTPVYRHPAQKLVAGMLLYTPGIFTADDRQSGGICSNCLDDLQAGNIPVLSLVNGLWVGEVPDELQILNLPERLLVGLYFPAVYVIKLYPQQKGAKHWDPAALNSGVRGNVSTYQLNTPDIAAMIEGKLLPHPPALLAATIAISIIGPNNLPVKSLPSFLSVNRSRVRNALLFLKKENHLYSDIIISEEKLRLLPEDGLPSELLTVIKYSNQQILLEREREGYVIGDDDAGNNSTDRHAELLTLS